MKIFPVFLCGDVIDVIYNVIALFLLFTVYCIFWIVVIFQLKWKKFLPDVQMNFFGQIEIVFKF